MLTALAVVGGFPGVPPENGWFHSFLHPVAYPAESGESHGGVGLLLMLMGVATVIALLGWGLAHYLYAVRPDAAPKWSAQMPGAYTTLLNKYYVDEFYDMVIVEPTKRLGMVWDWFDRTVIDGVVVGVGRLTESGASASTWIEKHVIYGFLNVVGYCNHLTARSWRKLQSGMVHHYAAIIIAGLFILVHLILAWWTGVASIGVALK